MTSQTKQRLQRLSLLLLVVILALGGLGLWARRRPNLADQPDVLSSQTPSTPVQPLAWSSKLLFTGNVFWGRYTNDWSMKSDLKYAYPFSRLNEFKRQDYDAWIAGLECPTSPRINTSSAQQEANLEFNCRPEYLPEAAKFFDVFTLANNHTDNQGAQGFAETKQELDKVGIQYFGHYDPRELNDNCEVIALPVTVQRSDQSKIKGHLPVAMCGFHGVFRIPSTEAISVMQRYAKLMPVFALPHSGAEYQAQPDSLKTNLYRQMIDNGADVVLGDHPHWVQSSEAYKGRLIIYSMGNFMFDQQFNSEVTRSAAVAVRLTSDEAEASNLAAWLKLAKQCRQFKDDCLNLAEQQQLTKLKLKFHYTIVGSDNAGKIVKPATPDQQARILERLRWSQTIQGLEAPHSGQ